MTAKQLYVAFQSSDELYQRTMAFVNAVQEAPGSNQQALLDRIPALFIDEVLHAFFEGPVDATGMSGSTASLIHGLMNMVGKASRALAGKVLSKVTPAEQQELARQFQAMTLKLDGQPYSGFPLDPEIANEALLVFEAYRAGDEDRANLVKVMMAMGDGAIEYFFDRPMTAVKVGMITRGLVNAGRATIEKASHSMNGKIVPDLDPVPRQRVLAYMENMLVEV